MVAPSPEPRAHVLNGRAFRIELESRLKQQQQQQQQQNSFRKDFGLISFFSAADVGSGLQAFDPNTVSMIILEEMPLLVSSSPAGCLIPDRVFAEDLICKREEELRFVLFPFVLYRPKRYEGNRTHELRK